MIDTQDPDLDPFVFLPRLKNAQLADDSFMAEAKCIDHQEIDFFTMAPKALAKAKAICHKCPVMEECLRYSIITEIEEGVWGGQDRKERAPKIAMFRQRLKEMTDGTGIDRA